MVTAKRIFFAAVIYLSPEPSWAQAGANDGGLPLPQWSDDDAAALKQRGQLPQPLGGLLWPENADLGLAGSLPLTPSSIADDGQTAQPPVDISSFLPPKLIQKAAASIPSPGAPKLLVDTPADYLLACAGIPSDHLLLDPWHHLTETNGEELEQFLAYHSENSSIRAVVMILGKGEQLPKNADLSQLGSGAVDRARSCLAVLPLGEPWRARIFLSQDVQASVPPIYLANLAGDCVSDAAQAPDEGEQVHRFLVRLSTRLFWLERMLPPQAKPPVAAQHPAPTLPRDLKLPRPQPALTEITEPSAARPAWSFFLERSKAYRDFFWLAIIVVGSGLAYFRWRAYKLRHYEWMLPDHPPELASFGAEVTARVAMVAYR
jgi:hypothetical protein